MRSAKAQPSVQVKRWLIEKSLQAAFGRHAQKARQTYWSGRHDDYIADAAVACVIWGAMQGFQNADDAEAECMIARMEQAREAILDLRVDAATDD